MLSQPVVLILGPGVGVVNHSMCGCKMPSWRNRADSLQVGIVLPHLQSMTQLLSYVYLLYSGLKIALS